MACGGVHAQARFLLVPDKQLVRAAEQLVYLGRISFEFLQPMPGRVARFTFFAYGQGGSKDVAHNSTPSTACVMAGGV